MTCRLPSSSALEGLLYEFFISIFNSLTSSTIDSFETTTFSFLFSSLFLSPYPFSRTSLQDQEIRQLNETGKGMKMFQSHSPPSSFQISNSNPTSKNPANVYYNSNELNQSQIESSRTPTATIRQNQSHPSQTPPSHSLFTTRPAVTGSRLLDATSSMNNTITSTPFTTINHLNSKSNRSNPLNSTRSPHSASNRINQSQKEHGVSQTVLAHRSNYPARSGKFITVVPPTE